MKKKFFVSAITLFLSIFICISITLNNTYAVWPDCNKLNKKGQIADETCAIIDSMEKINNGEKFIKLNNVGHDSEYSLLFFDTSEINGVLSNLTYNKDVSSEVSLRKYQREEDNKAISESIYSLGVGGTSLIVFKNIFDALRLKREDGNRFLQNPLGELNLLRHRIQNVAIFVPLAVATGISALIASFTCTINNYFSHKDIASFVFAENIKKDNYFSVLRSMLEYIENGIWNKNKILCISTDFDNNEAVVQLLDKKVSNDDSLDEQNKFDKNIERLKENIKSILNNVNE